MSMKITYVFHSCYIVETTKAVFVFDYYDGEIKELPMNKAVYFLNSHSHFDHCSEQMFTIAKKSNRTFIFSSDIKIHPNTDERVIVVKERMTYKIDEMTLHTFHSTDMGVAFLLETEEGNLYHAGDLNWWHWDGETNEYNEQMGSDYKEEIARIKEKDIQIDVAFLPLDQRLEKSYDWGMIYFMKHLEPRKVMPMHFFSENFDICKNVSKEHNHFKDFQSQFICIEKLNQVFLYN
ncbi:MAG: MBL fold metallo-hydrolase [Eubacteriales bacterium]